MEKTIDWFWRFVKGMFIGSGFILPGVSGGALAAIFGLYERIIRFLANMTKNFVEDVVFFIPVGLGALTGIVILSFGVSHVLENYETYVMWFFVGCIVGMLPSLWKEAGDKGRVQSDFVIMIFSFIMALALLIFGQDLFGGQVSANFFTWMIAGALIALGVLIPGLSPSNFILYMGMYKLMSDGFKSLDLGVIIPIGVGGLLTILLLSKLIESIFDAYYAKFFHFIFGVVLASTFMIVPTDYSGITLNGYAMCGLMLLLGSALGWWMSRLEEKYKRIN
ncbi:DUF368 domain-containing protein [Facklamia miroungae]|uniref:Putative membrane protein n=1 Tax=Facklamia miroungae TaxID=120956 RepID=A0A1G7QTF8_9LACT|nr:DUF368 domain-containing protein [Facklamia miroungae]NKZ29058.1 DUF368 domain-containing protein [Facklamia miroungae]SDG01792.1 putative membrane protein [Facklamia miroungae]